MKLDVRKFIPALAVIAVVVGLGVVGFNAQADDPSGAGDTWVNEDYSNTPGHRDPIYTVVFDYFNGSQIVNKVSRFDGVWGTSDTLGDGQGVLRLYVSDTSGYSSSSVTDPDSEDGSIWDGVESLNKTQTPDNPLQDSVSFHIEMWDDTANGFEKVDETTTFTATRPTSDAITLNKLACTDDTLEAYWRVQALGSGSISKVHGEYRVYGEDDWIEFDEKATGYTIDDVIMRNVSTTDAVEPGETYEVRAVATTAFGTAVETSSTLQITCPATPTPTPTPTETPTPTPTP